MLNKYLCVILSLMSGGYILESHYATNNIGTSTCTKCGYTGVIEYNEGLTQGNY